MANRTLYLALRSLLAPVVRQALRSGMQLRQLVEVLKQSYVDESIDELHRANHIPSASHISVMSGVHRKDVARILSSSEELPKEQSLIARVIAQWRTDPAYIAKNGSPKVLSMPPANSELVRLIEKVSREVNPATVIKELERSGAIRMTELGAKLTSSAYNVRDHSARAYGLLSRDVSNLFEVVEGNVSRERELPNLHITTEYDAIADEDIEEVREWLLREGSAFHEKVQKYLSSKDAEVKGKSLPAKQRNKVSITSFSLVSKASAKSSS